MRPDRRKTAATALVLIDALLAGCADYREKPFAADDDCKGCPPGGLFSGEDGVFTYGF